MLILSLGEFVEAGMCGHARYANKPLVVTVICRTAQLGIDLLVAVSRQQTQAPIDHLKIETVII
jgi:hypothetical protein